MMTLYDLQKGVQEDVECWIEEYQDDLAQNEDNVIKVIEEFVDGRVPVYTYDLLEVAMSNLHLAYDVPDRLGCNESHTPCKLIAYNIYEYLREETIDWYYKLEK